MLRFPVLSEGAEYLVMGHLMRRNILTYKAPPMNEGYDLICIHPDPRRDGKGSNDAPSLRIQVKSRYASDCDRAFPIKEDKLDCFDFLVVAFLNAGNFLTGKRMVNQESEILNFTLLAVTLLENIMTTAACGKRSDCLECLTRLRNSRTNLVLS